MAFSKELEEVIEAALADGDITEKERAVLHKKALQEGVDPDEVDVVVDGRLQQMQNEVDKAKQKVRKCPRCGWEIPAMSAVCPNPTCHIVFDTDGAVNKALTNYMKQLEKTLRRLKESDLLFYKEHQAKLESLIRQGKATYGNNKEIFHLITEVESELQVEIHRKEILAHNEQIDDNALYGGILLGLIATFLVCCYEWNTTPLTEIYHSWNGETTYSYGYRIWCTFLAIFSTILTIPISIYITKFFSRFFKWEEN